MANSPTSGIRFDPTNPRISISATSVHSPTIVEGPQSPVHSIHPKTSNNMLKRDNSDSSLPIEGHTKTMVEKFKQSEPFQYPEPSPEKGTFSEEKECCEAAAPPVETALPLRIKSGVEMLHPEGASMGVESLRASIVSESSIAPKISNIKRSGSPSSTQAIKSPFLAQEQVSQETLPRVRIPTGSRSPSLAQQGGTDTNRITSMFSLQDDNDEVWPSGEDDGVCTPVVIAAAHQAQLRRPVMVNNGFGSKSSRNLLRKERTRSISNMSTKAAQILGEKSPVPTLRREDAFIAREAAPLKTPISAPILYDGTGGTESYTARTRSFLLDTDLETADGLASLDTFRSARKLSLSEALHSHPPNSLDSPFPSPRRAFTTPTRKRKTSFTPPPIDPNPGKRFHRQSIISTPYQEFEDGKSRQFSFPKEGEVNIDAQGNTFNPEAILPVVLYSHSSPIPKLGRVTIPPSYTNENRLSQEPSQIPHALTRFIPSFPFTRIPIAKLHPARPPPFDDFALFSSLRKEYLRMRGPLRIFLSARTLTSIDLLSYRHTSQLCTYEKGSLRTKAFRVVDGRFAESTLLQLFHHPSLGRRGQEWVRWVRSLPANSTSHPSIFSSSTKPEQTAKDSNDIDKDKDNDKDKEIDIQPGGLPIVLPSGYRHPSTSKTVALEFVEGWSVPRISTALLLLITLSVTATLLWVFIGASGNQSFVVSIEGTKVVEDWRMTGLGWREGGGGRVEAGVLLGGLVLGVGSVVLGGWVGVSWLVM